MPRSTFPPWHGLKQRGQACTSWLHWREWRGRRGTLHSPSRSRVAVTKALRIARQRLSSKWSKRSVTAFLGHLLLSKGVANFHNSFLFQPTSAPQHNSGPIDNDWGKGNVNHSLRCVSQFENEHFGCLTACTGLYAGGLQPTMKIKTKTFHKQKINQN